MTSELDYFVEMHNSGVVRVYNFVGVGAGVRGGHVEGAGHDSGHHTARVPLPRRATDAALQLLVEVTAAAA